MSDNIRVAKISGTITFCNHKNIHNNINNNLYSYSTYTHKNTTYNTVTLMTKNQLILTTKYNNII